MHRRAILENGDVLQTTTLVQLISHDFWGVELNDAASHGSYRPLTVLSFRLTFAMVGLKAPVYHAANVALHCVVTALVVRLARRFLNGVGGVYLSGLLFAAHPVHCEAVAALVGRADLGNKRIFFVHTRKWLLIEWYCTEMMQEPRCFSCWVSLLTWCTLRSAKNNIRTRASAQK